MNRLSKEKSPYLLQHAGNPVEWYPWGVEAFEKAQREDKPIFLSIGYSTCHWCHVMERESFEDVNIAELMNKYFVNIKVDREERPDVDKVYMSAVQAMTGHGGWPLSAFLTPDLKPFYGGTYFPPKDGYGRPGFPSLLKKINEVWKNEKENILQSSDHLLTDLQKKPPVESVGAEIDHAILKRTYHQIAAGYDPKFAGFGAGPKFPRPVVLNFLLRYYYRTNDDEALRMSLTTLMAMANGGMYDHLGGGFHRYSVDAQWRVPHFEKMLYDQAQLVHSYLDAFQITHDQFFADIARETLKYVLREMTSPEGGFYSAEDADSFEQQNGTHKIEGAFYVWKKSEIEQIVTIEETKVFCDYYSVDERGNALSDPQNEFMNKNILFSSFTLEQTAGHCSLTSSRVSELLESAKKKLFEARSQRHRPHRDDKIITSWNGLMIGTFARASTVLADESFAHAAIAAAEFLSSNLYNKDSQTLIRRYRDGESKFEAHLDDYAFLASGLLDLFQSTSDVRWLTWANDLTGKMIALFWDSASGGFFDTSGKDKSVLVRMKEGYDGAEPAGNSIAVMNLLRLHRITQDDSLLHYAEKSIQYFSALLVQSPQFMPAMMSAVEYFLAAPAHVVIVPGKIDTSRSVLHECGQIFSPVLATLILKDDTIASIFPKIDYLKGLKTLNDGTTLYFCSGFTCQKPTIELDDVLLQIRRTNTVKS